MSCGIGGGDEVITTPFTFFATGAAITRLGARPIFVDIDAHTFNLDVARVEAAISPRTKAIIAVHLYGQCVDMQPLLELAAKHNLPVIEDTAQAIGAEDRGRRAGSMGTIGCLSFYPSKNLGGAGDGGMLVTNDEDHARRLRMLRVHGEEQKYHHELVGINSRLDEIQAAVLRAKLPHLDEWTRARQHRVKQYELMFTNAGLNEDLELPRVREDGRHVFHLFVIRVQASIREALQKYLSASGIGNGVLLSGASAFAGMLSVSRLQGRRFPLAEAAAASCWPYPHIELTDEHQGSCCEYDCQLLQTELSGLEDVCGRVVLLFCFSFLDSQFKVVIDH
jgi:dTDP-4-amino-4,6-dideoxygalactose transaminase